jgi:hypothetical protein
MKQVPGIFCFLMIALPLFSKNRKDVPLAPLPSVIANAKKVFLANGGGNNLAYDSFYSEIKKWGRYEIAGSPEEADLIIELAYRVEDGGARIWSSTNAYTGTTQIHSTHSVDPQPGAPSFRRSWTLFFQLPRKGGIRFNYPARASIHDTSVSARL